MWDELKPERLITYDAGRATSEDMFVTYDNYRQPNSPAAKRMENGTLNGELAQKEYNRREKMEEIVLE